MTAIIPSWLAGSQRKSMTYSLTVTLPDYLYRQLQRQAQVVNRPLAEVAATALASVVASVENDLPPGLQAELSAMADLSDDALWQIAGSMMNKDKVALYDLILERRQSGTLTPEGQAWLNTLRDEADALMLRKAHAYVLLKSRGYRLPTLDELHTQQFMS